MTEVCFLSGVEKVIPFFVTMSKLALRPTQSPNQWVLGALFPRVKQSGHEADHSPPSGAKAKDMCSYTSTPPYSFKAWCLFKKRDNFISTLIMKHFM
jgi:hypothetical protein